MLTESSVGPDVPAAPVSAISEPCGAVGTNANPTHLVPLFCAFAFEVEGTQKRYYSSAYPPVAPLNMSQSPPRSARRATSRRRLSKSILLTFARSARGSGAGPSGPWSVDASPEFTVSQAEGGARGRRAPLVVHDGALRAQPSTTFSLPLFSFFPPLIFEI